MQPLTICNFKDLQNHLANIDRLSPRVAIDLSAYNNFIRPIFIVSIAQFIRMLRSRGYDVRSIILPSNTDSRNYLLQHVDLITLFESNFEPTKVNDSFLTTLPLMSIQQERIPDKKTEIVQFLRNYCPHKEFTAIEVSLDEILNNCFDHALSQTGIIGYGQYYRRTNTIKLAVCDTGIGIPDCVNNYFRNRGENLISSEAAIEWAFQPNNTTQSLPTNRGRGLNTLHTAIAACNGTYTLITHDKWLMSKSGVRQYRDTYKFFGTAIEFELNIDNLPDLELEDFEYDF